MVRSGRPRHRARVRVVVAVVAACVVASTLVVGAFAWNAFFRPLTTVASGRSVTVTVPAGAGTAVIGTLLAKEGVVANPTAFRIRAGLAGADGKLRAGRYDFETGMSYGDAIDALMKGPPPRFVVVTIPEGFVIEQIAARLESALGIPRAETLELAQGGAAEFADDHPYLRDAHEGSLEGYLFPKTYSVPADATARQVLEMMLDQFDVEFSAVDVSVATAEGLSAHEIVTIASIIEREAKLAPERPVVSSVIRNRLSIGMRLEIDATIEYVLPGNRFRLTYKDLEIDSPYNTYRNAGLPPGPISSPGLASLQAAAAPASTDYLYYVLTGKDGSHTFATNKRDFLKAKERSKEVFGR